MCIMNQAICNGVNLIEMCSLQVDAMSSLRFVHASRSAKGLRPEAGERNCSLELMMMEVDPIQVQEPTAWQEHSANLVGTAD